MTSREQFEKWICDGVNSDVHRGIMLSRYENGNYIHLATKHKWDAWQASRAAIEIDIPPGVDVGKVTGSDGRIMYWIEEGAVRNIIECEGLKVKKMKLQLNEIMTATVSELDDLDMELAFEIEAVERQLSQYDREDKVWRQKAIKARDHMQRTRALVRTRLDKLYYGEERMLHGAILAEIRKTMPIGKFMDAVNRAKVKCGMLNKNSPQ